MLRWDRSAFDNDIDDDDDDDDDSWTTAAAGEEGRKQEVRVYNVGDNDLSAWRVHWGELAMYIEWNDDDDRFN